LTITCNAARQAQLLEELESLVQEIGEVDARAQELGLSKEEYAFLNVVKNYLSTRSENDLAAFVKARIVRSRRCSSSAGTEK
jgi:hypothetical protein